MDDTCRIDDCDKPIRYRRNRLCKMHQQRLDRNGRTDLRPPAEKKPCSVEGCTNLTRSGSAALCPKHYHRQYRHGDIAKTAAKTDVSVSKGRRYRTRYAPNHPTANCRGRAYEHRMVLHDQIGPGAHPCHWCGTEVQWKPTADEAPLHVDHLDGDGANNDPTNLVASCRRCNSARASQARERALREAGWWSGNDTVARLGVRRPLVEPEQALADR